MPQSGEIMNTKEMQLLMSLVSLKNWYCTNLQDVTRLESNASLSTGDSVVSQRVVIELGSDVDLRCFRKSSRCGTNKERTRPALQKLWWKTVTPASLLNIPKLTVEKDKKKLRNGLFLRSRYAASGGKKWMKIWNFLKGRWTSKKILKQKTRGMYL